MKKRIDQLRIEGFRGATKPFVLDFDSHLPVTLIFGENASGKSTLVDAIEFVCNGNIGSLGDRSLGRGHRRDAYLPALGKQRKDVNVVIRHADIEWSAKLASSGPELCSAPDRPRAHVIRRKTLLGFVEAEPAERYRKLSSFILVPNVEKAEQTLRDRHRTAKQNTNDAARAVAQAGEELVKYWELEGKFGSDAESWARMESKKDPQELRSHIEHCQSIINDLSGLSSALEDYRSAEASNTAAQSRLKASQGNLADAESKLTAGSGALLDVLKDAKSYFEDNPEVDTCPVCERGDIQGAALSTRIGRRINDLNELDLCKTAVRTAERAAESAAANLAGALRKVKTSSRTLAGLMRDSDLEEVKALAVNWSDYPLLLKDDDQYDVEGLEQARSLNKEAALLSVSVNNKMENEQRLVSTLNAIKQFVQTIDDKTMELAQWNELQKRFKKALGIVESKRKSYVDNVLNSISREVDQLYQRVHPDEALGNLRMYLDPNQRGSLNFEGRFESEQAIQPQAYYSESHLDTLGICVFLALVKLYGSEDSIIVLDDVFTSVDAPHLDRIIALIHDEGDQFNHVIITTHYRPWRDRYHFYRGPALKIQTVDLLGWSVEHGIRHSKTLLSAEGLTSSLDAEPMDRQGVASKAGILLESLLDHLTLLYECRLPRRPAGDYTLGDLLNGINKKLLNSLSVSNTENSDADKVELKPLINTVGSHAWVRNQVGAHFSIAGMEIPDNEVRAFGQGVLNLADALICDTCGELPRKDKSGIDRQCRCGMRHLQPLKMPS